MSHHNGVRRINEIVSQFEEISSSNLLLQQKNTSVSFGGIRKSLASGGFSFSIRNLKNGDFKFTRTAKQTNLTRQLKHNSEV